MAIRLPGTTVHAEDRYGLSVMNKGKAKGYAWTWMERVDPKKARVANMGVLAVVVPNLSVKEMILSSDGRAYFTEPHYNGFPAVLVRLSEIEPADLEDLLIEAWRCKASVELQREFTLNPGHDL